MISRNPTRDRRALALASTYLVLVLAMSAGRVQATAEAPATAERTALIARLEAGVESLDGLDTTQRAAMLRSLRGFLDAGLDPDRLVGLFPAGGEPHLTAAEARRAQDAVAMAIADGLPADLILTKIQEGCRKRVASSRVVDAAVRMGEALRVADDFLTAARSAGLAGRDSQEPGWVRSVALNVWGGISAGDLTTLQREALARDGGSSLENLVAASDCAASLLTAGATSGEAVELAAAALGKGLSPEQMREMSALVLAAYVRAPVGDVLLAVRDKLGQGASAREIADHLLQAGWLGPADVPGVGQAGPSAGPGSPGYPGGAGSDSRLGTGATPGGS